CSPLPQGSGPVPSPDTADAFLVDADFASAAESAVAPLGYLSTFTNIQASPNAPNYLGYHTLSSYYVPGCADFCSSTATCTSFNIFFERSPSLEPADDCPNPPSTTLIKCALWGSPISAELATNFGQYRNDFHVVLAGSNGYSAPPPESPPAPVPTTLAGYHSQFLNNSAINAPLDCNGAYTFMGAKTFPATQVSDYDPAICDQVCTEQNEYNTAHPPSDGSEPQICSFFNAYLQLKNGAVEEQVCAMYTRAWPLWYATNRGQWRDGDEYTI
ncbi:hypothetical protein BS50DRAFT_472244, partial [Corynespora cassiicola Philippines]